ncbi:MAG: (deoxy)nucleoside triphosphate pyrophosphohydrolase [Planctomycetes bacterium]|nr:(deoxy)nucleoside triphosphate pyrophosphohydrolase [Planctomycetota bacterium]
MTKLINIAIAVVKNGDRFLVGQRPQDQVLAGFWEFPGGKIEPGESDIEAAVRECCEETGVTVVAVGRYMTVEHSYEHGDLRLSFIACEPQLTECALNQGFCWVQREQLAELDFPEANADIVKQLSSHRELVRSINNQRPSDNRNVG